MSPAGYAPRAAAAASGIALVVMLSLNWFAPAAGHADASLEVSGWTGLSPFSVAFLVVGAIVTIAGRGVVAVAVCAIALAILLVDLLTLDDVVVLRWPAYVGVFLAVDLLLWATWSWRVR